MMRKISTPADSRTLAILFVSLLVLALTAGCSKKPPVEDTPVAPDSEFSDGSDQTDPNAGMTRLTAADVRFPAVYFDLDSTQIRSEYQAGLESGAAALKDSGATVVVAGHCDERGSEEYNVALGERRADSVRKYLYNLGVPMGQMSIVSYGEAQPAVSGRGENAWRLNRRAEFSVR